MKEAGGGGDGVTKIIYINVSLILYIIIHQYIDAQSHLLHTLSLSHSLSLSPSHPHTHSHTTSHTTHTLTQSKSGKCELIRFLEVEEVGL